MKQETINKLFISSGDEYKIISTIKNCNVFGNATVTYLTVWSNTADIVDPKIIMVVEYDGGFNVFKLIAVEDIHTVRQSIGLEKE